VRGRSFRSLCLFSTSSNTVFNPWHSLRYVGKSRLDKKTYNCMMYIAFLCCSSRVSNANPCSHLSGRDKLGANNLCGKGGLSQAKDDRSWDSGWLTMIATRRRYFCRSSQILRNFSVSSRCATIGRIYCDIWYSGISWRSCLSVHAFPGILPGLPNCSLGLSLAAC
jgi:hypothetical protein